MFEHIRQQIMDWFTERRGKEDQTEGLLVSLSATYLLGIINNRARRYRFHQSTPSIFEVVSNETFRNYRVDLQQQSCTCSIWQSTGYPCGHALAILLHQQKDPQLYVKSFFTIEAYKKTYENAIFPPILANVTSDIIHSPPSLLESDEELSDSDDDSVLPPSTRRPPGRPKKRRIRSNGEVDCEKRIFRCGRCGETGHSKRTCHEPI